MPWLQSVFGSDGSPIIQYVTIFVVIFTALAAIVFVVRRLTGRGLALPGRGGGRGRQPRLGIVDVYELDRARQLILLRRDNVEHLLLVGGPNDVVVERNIQRGQRALPEPGLRPETAAGTLAGPAAEPPPDALPGMGRLPEPVLSPPERLGMRPDPPFAPSFEMPVVVSAPIPGSGMAPPVTLPLDPALLAGDEPGLDIPAPVRAPAAAVRSATAPAAQPPAPAREPFSARRILRRTLSPDAGTGPAPGRATRDEVAGVPPDPSRPGAATSASSGIAAERGAVDPLILSDMARQLQAALARPAPAAEPMPAAAGIEPAPEPRRAVDPAVPAEVAVEPPVVEVPPLPVETPAAAPDAETAPEAEVAPGPPPVAAAPPAANTGNPFSVEEIEAEFARLLGRPLDKRG